MMITWATDTHLEFATDYDLHEFFKSVSDHEGEVVALTGDITTYKRLSHFLTKFEDVGKPVYFVLGNHDAYESSILQSRQLAANVAKPSRTLHFLNGAGTEVLLTRDTAIVGIGGWADALLGDFYQSRVELNDYYEIAELKHFRKDKRLLALKLLEIAQADTRMLLPSLEKAITWGAKHILVLTHVPPFYEATIHEGKPSDDNWMPHFSSKTMGMMLENFMRNYPDKTMEVLCGHTHGEGVVDILPNLKVRTGGAMYYMPRVQPTVIVP